MTPPEPARPGPEERAATRRTYLSTSPSTTTSTTSSHSARRVAGLLALAGVTAGLVAAPLSPAAAVANVGQAVNNDYGQTVAAEIRATVEANPHVKAAITAASAAHTLLVARLTSESRARAAYLAAVHSRVASRIVKTKRTYTYVHSLRMKATAASTAANAALVKTRATVTAQVKATHFRPVDGTFAGPVQNYLVPTLPKFSFEPLQVRISVYGGHVSNVEVIAQAPVDSDSNSYNVMSLSTLCLEAMAAHDTANVAAVSGASLSSEAFQQSLTAALVAAGYKA
jgi:uncharacterized protein with FMN-binding domain